MTNASGKWLPHPRFLELQVSTRDLIAKRQRFGTELLSFDGNLLRSYALSLVYEEDATRAMEESFTVGSGKVDSDEVNSREVVFPRVCLQSRQPVSLIAEASTTSLGSAVKTIEIWGLIFLDDIGSNIENSDAATAEGSS